MDQTAVAHEGDDGPAEFNDRLGCEVGSELVEHFLVDVVVVDEETLRVAKSGLFVGAEVSLGPVANLGDCGFVERGTL